jgi:ankyrin repeat protein
LKPHEITLRRQRKQRLLAHAHRNQPVKQTLNNHHGQHGQHGQQQQNTPTPTTAVAQPSGNNTTPWRAQPRFAMWRLQWWLSRYVLRWRFVKKIRAVRTIQLRYRYSQRRHLKTQINSAIVVQAHWRAAVAREQFKLKQMKHYHRHALVLQTAWWHYVQNCHVRQLMKDVLLQAKHQMARMRYEKAMKEDGTKLVDRIHVLSRMQSHVNGGPPPNAHRHGHWQHYGKKPSKPQITERYFVSFTKRMFRYFKRRVQAKKQAYLDPNVNNPKHIYKLEESLLLACRRGDVVTVRNLLNDNVSPSCCNERGDTCLHMAVAGSSVEVIELLLKFCANISASDVLGRTSLHVVCETGNQPVLLALLQHYTASSTASSNRRATKDIDAVATGSITPLHLCGMLGHDVLAKELLLAGASFLVQDTQGMTALHHAAAAGHTDVVNLLGEHDEDMVLLSLRDSSGNTALHSAVSSGRLDTVKCLLGFTFNPNLRNDGGMNCMDIATSVMEPEEGNVFFCFVLFVVFVFLCFL